MQTEKQKLINQIDKFCTDFGMSPSGFSRAALNNANFRGDLDSADFHPKSNTIDRVRAWMQNQRKTRQKKLNTELKS